MMAIDPQLQDTLSLEQIEDSYWGEPAADATRLVQTAHQIRRKPIGTLSVEDLRLLLGQQIGVAVLIPLALGELERVPLAEGDFYPGDLLATVLRLPHTYWQGHSAQRECLERIVQEVEKIGDLNEHGAPHDVVWEQINDFHRRVQG
ncbi:MAG: hypothetical protein QOI21_1561 [Actinomycetota bacterium]|jgi:hypothetical protein|nr:hypothetical protein [Actinomycetota bacterium]